MSDNKVQVGEVYDLTKNLTGLEINTGFILGLERILILFLTKLIEDKATIPVMFQKFEKVITEGNAEEIEFTEMEANVYTLFALQQLLRAAAYEQNLVKKTSATLDESKVKDMLKAYMDNDSTKIEQLYDEIKKDLSSQI